MPEHDSHRQRVQKLLAQDQEINKTQMKEFLVQLERSLESWDTTAKRIRRRILIAVAVYAAAMFLHAFFVVAHNSVRNGPFAIMYGVLLWGNLVTLFGSFFIGIWLIALYFFKYSPGLKRAQFDVHTAMMLELQQQVQQLRQDMNARGK